MQKLLPVHGQFARMEEIDAKLDEREKQEEVQRRYNMDADQGCELIQTKDPGEKYR